MSEAFVPARPAMAGVNCRVERWCGQARPEGRHGPWPIRAPLPRAPREAQIKEQENQTDPFVGILQELAAAILDETGVAGEEEGETEKYGHSAPLPDLRGKPTVRKTFGKQKKFCRDSG